jgi:threonine synthase
VRLPEVVLRCTACGAEADVTGPGEVPRQVCDGCFGPLAVVLDVDDLAARVDRDSITIGPASMWRYAPLLPVASPRAGPPVGWTPLVPAPNLGDAVGVDDLWIKDETQNPTGSFKDRVVSTALGAAPGASVAACASTGNLARSVAALAPVYGMRAVVLVPDHLPGPEVDFLRARGAIVVRVAGPYDAANRLSVEAAMTRSMAWWAWVNVTLRAWYVLGAATIGYEIAEQLGWCAPVDVVVPAASGAMACQVAAAVDLVRDLGFAAGRAPALHVAQPAGGAPIAAAFAAGAHEVTPLEPATSVGSVAMGDPPEGADVLARARATGGSVVAVDEGELDPMIDLIAATTGMAVEPAGALAVAAARDLAVSGRLRRGGPCIAVLTGGPARVAALADPMAEPGPPPVTIAPTLAALVEALTELTEEGRA